MDYGMPSFRKSKGDKKAKGRYTKYKRGGKHRSDDITYTGREKTGNN